MTETKFWYISWNYAIYYITWCTRVPFLLKQYRNGKIHKYISLKLLEVKSSDFCVLPFLWTSGSEKESIREYLNFQYQINLVTIFFFTYNMLYLWIFKRIRELWATNKGSHNNSKLKKVTIILQFTEIYKQWGDESRKVNMWLLFGKLQIE